MKYFWFDSIYDESNKIAKNNSYRTYQMKIGKSILEVLALYNFENTLKIVLKLFWPVGIFLNNG